LDFATLTWLTLGFGLGLVHAFDADHVMTLSVLSSRGRNAADGVRVGLRWAVGHGLVLLVAGCAFLFLGRSLPPGMVAAAERGVGFVMIALGLWVWHDLVRRRSHLHFHAHDDLPPHAHWHSHDRDDVHRHEHGAVLIGGLHGLAGSAPILAVLPAAARSPMLGIGYLLLFAAGVSLAMGLVSGSLGHLAKRLAVPEGSRRLSALRAWSASGSIVLGLWMLALGF
jgi:ABC-type nickel/cobalt efflux system permease component RcnA